MFAPVTPVFRKMRAEWGQAWKAEAGTVSRGTMATPSAKRMRTDGMPESVEAER
jgi:hypothetical protein